MNYNQLTSVLARVFSLGAILMIALALIEYAANVFGYTIVREAHRPGRLIEIAATLVVIVIALLLRQIRDELRKKS